MGRALAAVVLGLACALGVGWAIVSLTMGAHPTTPPSTASAVQTSPVKEASARIRANLFYVSEDGMRLIAVEREVPFDADTASQARLLIEEQLKPAPPPLAQALPAGTTLRALFVTGQGTAFVDLSEEATTAHSGGSLDELFSVFAIVNVLTANLPAIGRVQILVAGKEVDTLAGHIDLREPLQKSFAWVTAPPPAGEEPPAIP
jgi:spore germination protein GerM